MSTITTAEVAALCRLHGMTQAIVLAFDGSKTTITTHGESDADAATAAEAGNRILRWLGVPEAMCRTESAKVARLHDRIAELEQQLEALQGK